jgi:hypothetical protein
MGSMYAGQFALTQDVFKNKSLKSITKNKSIEIQEASNSVNDASPTKTEGDAPDEPASSFGKTSPKIGQPSGAA